MTDKLPPAHLRDLADQIWNASNDETMNALRRTLADEAARREAEQKELGQTARSADAGNPIVEREGLDSADAELAHSLRSVVTVNYEWSPTALSIIRRYETDRHNAAETINRLLRHVEHWRVSLVAEQKANDTLKARVAELEAENKAAWNVADSFKTDVNKTEAKAARLAVALRGLRIMFMNDGEGSIEHYDRVAEVFRLQTGFMRPGKSQPMHYTHTDEERRSAWDKWVAKLLSSASAALAEAGHGK